MAIYAEVKRFDTTQYGQVRFIDSADPLPIGDQKRILFIDLTGVTPVPEVRWYYDSVADTFSETKPAGAVVPRRTLKASELWMKSFTDTERSKVWALCNGETVTGVTVTQPQRYRLASFRDITLAGESIPLHNEETETVIDALESIGLLAVGRADEILER